MKRFEEWWNDIEYPQIAYLKGYGYYRASKDTWKAALEWVLSLGDNEEPYTWENIINHKIKEELED